MTQEDINDLLARNPSPEAQIQYEEMRTLKQAKGAHINHATCHECPCKLNFDAMKAELEQWKKAEVGAANLREIWRLTEELEQANAQNDTLGVIVGQQREDKANLRAELEQSKAACVALSGALPEQTTVAYLRAELEQEETDHQETAKYLEDTRQKHLKAEADRAELLGLLQWADEHLLPHKWLDISEPGCRIPEMREALAKHGG